MIPNQEKVLRGLDSCGFYDGIPNICEVTECPYRDDKCGCVHELAHDAGLLISELLKAHDPRVMTLGDLRDIGSVWELNTPPYLWMDINPSYRWSRGFWVAWREIYDMIDGLHPTYNADNYGKIWRCWTSKPSLKQMEETPWEKECISKQALL